MNNKIGLALAALMFAPTASAERFIPASDEGIVYSGRYFTTPEGDKAFNFPGFTTRLNFSGRSLRMATSPGSGYFMAEIDSLPPVKIRFAETDSVMTLAAGLAAGNHTARITYAIEGFEFNPRLRGFLIDDDAAILQAPDLKQLKIEFIGNSITCGYGTEVNSPQIHFSYDTENHCLSFAHLIGRALDADVNVVARSGIGVYRNYDGPREGSPSQTMPLEYGNTLLYDYTHPWDFSRFRPDIICINLGTNDMSTGNYDIDRFESAYHSFLGEVRRRNPEAKIVLLTGPLLNGRELELVKGVLDRVAENQPQVYRFDMTPATGEYGYGADYHPSAARARIMADELTEFLNSIR